METLMDSLSSGEQIILSQERNLAKWQAPYQGLLVRTPLLTGDSINVAELSANQITSYVPELAVHPLIQADRTKALDIIKSALAEARALKQEIYSSVFDGPICPYKKTLVEYLGPNFICPTIDDLAFPQNFNPIEAVKSIVDINRKLDGHMTTQLQIMSAEAADTSFAGITSQNLGNAFAVLSTTANGQEYIIDRKKAAEHLEFIEIVNNIPTDYIIENPVIVALKLVSRYLEIHRS